MFTFLVFSFCFSLTLVQCWDNDEFEVFDLVEEVNENFYGILGISNSASSSEIRKAYRKLSMHMHPDKNKEEGAEEKFRQINAIYEILKDEKRRAQYDHVLEFGLPDWRQPVYYYRKVRKLGLLETSFMVFSIFTVGHFLIIWAAYFEKKFEMEEVFKSRKKKDKKARRNKTAATKEDEDILQELLQSVPRPKFADLLPFKCVRGGIGLCMGLCKSAVAALGRLREMRRVTPESETETSEDEQGSIRMRRKRVDLHLEKTPEMASFQALVSCMPDSQITCDSVTDSDKDQKMEERPWTTEDDHLLAKAVSKFPGGTGQRWEKIATILNRPTAIVIKKAKTIQSDYSRKVDASAQGITGASEIFSNCSKVQHLENMEISKSYVTLPGSTTRRRVCATNSEKSSDQTLVIANHNLSTSSISQVHVQNTEEKYLKGSKHAHNNVEVENTGAALTPDSSQFTGNLWSQNQQKIFEWSLAQYPKGTPDRWDKITDEISGKTKEDCIARFKLLASIVQKKKQAQQQ